MLMCLSHSCVSHIKTVLNLNSVEYYLGWCSIMICLCPNIVYLYAIEYSFAECIESKP